MQKHNNIPFGLYVAIYTHGDCSVYSESFSTDRDCMIVKQRKMPKSHNILCQISSPCYLSQGKIRQQQLPVIQTRSVIDSKRFDSGGLIAKVSKHHASL